MDGEIIEVRVTCSYAVKNVVADNLQKGLSNMGFRFSESIYTPKFWTMDLSDISAGMGGIAAMVTGVCSQKWEYRDGTVSRSLHLFTN